MQMIIISKSDLYILTDIKTFRNYSKSFLIYKNDKLDLCKTLAIIEERLELPSPMEQDDMAGKTLYDKLWDDHVVTQRDDGSCLLYIDRHLLHEVTSPQAFEGLQLAGRQPWRLSANVATPDHNVPTSKKNVIRASLVLKMIHLVFRFRP